METITKLCKPEKFVDRLGMRTIMIIHIYDLVLYNNKRVDELINIIRHNQDNNILSKEDASIARGSYFCSEHHKNTLIEQLNKNKISISVNKLAFLNDIELLEKYNEVLLRLREILLPDNTP